MGSRQNTKESVPSDGGSSKRAESSPKGGGWSQKEEVLKQGIGVRGQDFGNLRLKGDYQDQKRAW